MSGFFGVVGFSELVAYLINKNCRVVGQIVQSLSHVLRLLVNLLSCSFDSIKDIDNHFYCVFSFNELVIIRKFRKILLCTLDCVLKSHLYGFVWRLVHAPICRIWISSTSSRFSLISRWFQRRGHSLSLLHL